MISIVLPNVRGGGAEKLNILLSDEFIRRGYHVDLVLMQAEGELLKDVSKKIAIIDLKANRFRAGFWPLIKYFNKKRPLGIISAMWPLTGLTALALKTSTHSANLVLSEHNNLSRSDASNKISKWLHTNLAPVIYGKKSHIVAVSNGVRLDLLSRTSLGESAVCVIYNPTKRPEFTGSIDKNTSEWWSTGVKKFIAIGSLKTQKDYPNLLSAFSRVRESVDAKLLILGDGVLRGDIEALILKLGLQDSVLMPGFVPDPYPYLDQSDLFVLSSAWEGLPGVLIEALVSGVPVVSTNCPSGPAEILEDGKYGRLVPVGDPQALAKAIIEALDAPVDREMLKRRGNEFSVERAADQYLALLDPGGKMLANR